MTILQGDCIKPGSASNDTEEPKALTEPKPVMATMQENPKHHVHKTGGISEEFLNQAKHKHLEEQSASQVGSGSQ
jgi:hypothetical protein